ncbi:hypothetical protein BOX15_Mlig018980g1, partial [Macrostomum lignano]
NPNKMASADIDQFIQEQKQRLAADRQRIGNSREAFPPGPSTNGGLASAAKPTVSTAAVPTIEFPRPQSNNSKEESSGGLFSKLGAYADTRRAFDESRREDYLKLRKPVPAAFPAAQDPPVPAYPASMSTAGSGSGSGGGLGIVGGLRDSTSARQRKERQRNAEYNEYLRMKEQEQQRKRQPQQQQQQQLHQPPRQAPLLEIPQQPTPPPPPQQQPQPSNRVDFTSLDDLERRVAELRGFTAVQPPAASSRYPGGAAPTAGGLADGSKDPVSRLEQLEAEYENLRKMLLRQNAQQQQQPQPQKPHQPPASSTRLKASSFATSTSSASSAAVATVGGAIDTRRPDTASQRERKRQAYKAELERQLAEQKQQKQRPSLQEQSATRPGIGDLSSLQSSKPSPPAGYLGLDLDDGGGGGLGSYGLGIYEGLSASQAAAPTSNRGVRFVEPSLTTQKEDPVASGGGGGLLALGTEQERKAQAAARQKAEYAKELERQMAEKRATEIKRKREREEFERKKEAEIAAYDPFGKGGGGAPIKDAQGNTRANLKQVMRETDDDRLSNSGHRAAATGDGYDDFRGRGGDFSSGVAPAGSADRDDWMQQLDGLKDLQTRLSKSFTDDFGGFSNATAANATNSRQQKDVQQQEKQQQQQPQHARGGHGIFGRGLSDEQKRQRERYQEELRQQVEEQRRAKEAERKRQAEEDLKEQRRAEEQQRRMQAEAEAERRRQAEKEAAARQRNEELRLAAEEQRKQAAAAAAAARRRRDVGSPPAQPPAAQHHHHQQQQQRYSPRAASPPVPAIRTQMEVPPKQQKPPTPRQQQQQQQQQQHQSLQRQSTAASVASAPEPESIEQLARLRNQLRSERRRIEEALDAGGSGAGSGSANGNGAGTYRVRGSSAGNQVDVFDMARDRRKPVAAKRNIAASSGGAAAAAAAAAGKTSSNRRNFDDIGGLAPSDLGLGSIGGGGYGGETFESMQLDSESAFVDIDQPLSPSGFEQLGGGGGGGGGGGALSPTVSLDVDRIDRANEARLKRLQRLQADAVSLNDPEEVLSRFMSRQTRPVSGQTGHEGDD